MKFEWIREISTDLKKKFSRINSEDIESLYRVDEFYLVFFSWKYGESNEASSRNAWKVDDNFKVVWKVQPYENPYLGGSPYTGVDIRENDLLIRSGAGVYLKLDFETGKVTLIPGQRPW